MKKNYFSFVIAVLVFMASAGHVAAQQSSNTGSQVNGSHLSSGQQITSSRHKNLDNAKIQQGKMQNLMNAADVIPVQKPVTPADKNALPASKEQNTAPVKKNENK